MKWIICRRGRGSKRGRGNLNYGTRHLEAISFVNAPSSTATDDVFEFRGSPDGVRLFIVFFCLKIRRWMFLVNFIIKERLFVKFSVVFHDKLSARRRRSPDTSSFAETSENWTRNEQRGREQFGGGWWHERGDWGRGQNEEGWNLSVSEDQTILRDNFLQVFYFSSFISRKIMFLLLWLNSEINFSWI